MPVKTMTFKGKLTAAFAAFTLLTLVVGLTGIQKLSAVSQRAELPYHINHCLENTYKLQKFSPLAADQKSDVWKKAKDRFIKELKRLSQTPGLTKQERETIQNIENSWQNYDITFRKYIIVQKSDCNTLIQPLTDIVSGLNTLSAYAQASNKAMVHQAKSILMLTTLLATVLGIALSLVIIRHFSSVFTDILHRLDSVFSRPGEFNSSEEAIEAEVKNIETLVRDLNTLLGERPHVDQEEPKVQS